VLVNQKDAWQKRTATERSLPRTGGKRKHDPAPA
jgi:hypothetical protein